MIEINCFRKGTKHLGQYGSLLFVGNRNIKKECVQSVTIFFGDKACRGMLYMIGRLTFVGFMVQRLQIVWVWWINSSKQAKYWELEFLHFPRSLD